MLCTFFSVRNAVSGARKQKKKTPCICHAMYILLNLCGLRSGLLGMARAPSDRKKNRSLVELVIVCEWSDTGNCDFRQIPGYYLKLGHDHCFAIYFHLLIHQSVCLSMICIYRY